jgi:hypothetical protein
MSNGPRRENSLDTVETIVYTCVDNYALSKDLANGVCPNQKEKGTCKGLKTRSSSTDKSLNAGYLHSSCDSEKFM